MSGRRGLTARLRLALPRLDLELALHVPAGSTLALLGPNGAGKSTTLALLAGLRSPDEGRVELDGRVLTDVPAGGRRGGRRGGGASVPVADRGVGMVFQDHLLFAHLNVLENVAFGPRSRGVPAAAARAGAQHWLEVLGVGHLAGARPRQLSGGQAQRVALARALAGEPSLLLLDEPLAALDAETRAGVRAELAQRLAAFAGPVVLVTHDPLEAVVLADRVLVVESGRAVQEGTPAEVARAPRTAFAAALAGLNLVRGVVRVGPGTSSGTGSGTVLDAGGVAVVSTDRLDGTGAAGSEALAAFPPGAVALHRERPTGSARNAWAGAVAGLEQHAGVVRVRVAGALPGTEVLADVTPAAVAELALAVGLRVWASVKATEVRVYRG